MRFLGCYLFYALIGVQIIYTHAYCPESALTPLPFVLEYAVWRGWHQVIIYTPELEQGCKWATVRLMKCLSINGVASSSDTSDKVRLHAHLGVVVLAPRLYKNATGNLTKLLKKLHELQMGTSPYDWLITARSYQDFGYINEVLNTTSIRFDQNIVVTYTYGKNAHERTTLDLCDINFIYENPYKSNNQFKRNQYNDNSRSVYSGPWKRKTDYEKNYYRTTDRFRNLTRHKTYKRDGSIIPLFHAGVTTFNYSRVFNMINISKFSLKPNYRKLGGLSNFGSMNKILLVIQYFKVRENSTLYAYNLGDWNRFDSMSFIEAPFPVEARNFLGEELIIGRCNTTDDGSFNQDDDGPTSGPMLDDILNFLSVRLNSSSLIRYYGKLGFRTYEGSWTGLLGALIDHSVDMALEPVTVHPARREDMDFIFPIAETMCNIYIRQQETSTVRDIFLAPFSFRLVACVGGVALLAALAIVIISRMTSSLTDSARRMGYTEAVLWSTGILCQQGGTWTPSNPAASILLIVCLFFAVVTYNSYAAFITSVLSVRVASVDTIAAVLHSPNFKIGYIRNGADQMYLMSTKDVQLNAFYIRGYSDADNLVSSAEEGLARVAQQDYAFFAGQRVARSTLRSLSQARGRCAVRELPVYSSRAHLAFPLPRYSPYARSTLVCFTTTSKALRWWRRNGATNSTAAFLRCQFTIGFKAKRGQIYICLFVLLQLRSGGALARLEAALVPDMPQCASPAGFASARATDVRSALILFAVGLVFSSILGLGEYSWKNRQKLKTILVACYVRLINLTMQ